MSRKASTLEEFHINTYIYTNETSPFLRNRSIKSTGTMAKPYAMYNGVSFRYHSRGN